MTTAPEPVRVRHDAAVIVRVTCDMVGHKRPCQVDTVEARLLDAHLTTVSFMHGKVSGMDSGVKVRARVKLADPERDVLKDGELCDCEECLS